MDGRRGSIRRVGRMVAVVLVLGGAGYPALVAARESEAVVYEQSFSEGDLRGWELGPGWRVVEQTLIGEGHHWAQPAAGPWRDFRLQFRLNLMHGVIHLVYRLNEAGRYFIGFREYGTYLHKQYWPDTFLEGLAGSEVFHGLGHWHDIEIVGTGPRLQFFVDGGMEWECTDSEPLLQGTFAFETLDDSAARIDDIVVYAASLGTHPAWVRTGGPLGGLGYDVRMRPDDPNVMYVTDAKAGVHMSADGGQTWFPSNQGITTRTGESGDTIPVFCLTIDPHDYDTIWIGTQDVRGVFRSEDAGHTWVEMDHGVVESMGITLRGFTVDPRSSDIVYAAAELSSWAWAGEPRNGREFDMTKGVVYKTTNGGDNWTAVWRGDNLARYIWIDPRDPDVVYVSTGIFDREAANSVPASGVPGGVGVIKSIDGGKTWDPANNGLGNLYVGTLFMHPTNPSVLLAGTGNNQYYDRQGVYLSVDGAGSWQRTLADDNINAVEFALSDSQVAYAGSAQAVYRSGDGGQTWDQVSGGPDGWGPPGVRAGFPIDFQVDPVDPNRLFTNNYGGGNFLSLDGGHTWTVASEGYTGAQVRDVAVDPTDASRVFAAARSGLFRSTEAGDNWEGLSYPPFNALEWYVVAVDPEDPRHVLTANNWNGRILQSYDGGRTLHAASEGLGEGKGWRAIAFAPSDPMVVYAGASAYVSAGTFDDRIAAAGIYISRNRGATWTASNDAVSATSNVTALAVDPRNAEVVYAATGNDGLLKTMDGGQSWRKINQGLPSSPVALSVAVHPAVSSTVYAGLASAGLYQSFDSGQTWQALPAGLAPEATITEILFDPMDAQRMYVADKHGGVYRSLDAGAIWSAVNEGLRVRAVNAMAISSDGRRLYAATEGEGVFRLDLEAE